MLLPNSKKTLKGFCTECFSTKIDDESRLRFSKEAIKILKAHNIEQLWRFPDITHEGIILCPEQSLKLYTQTVEQHLSKDDNDNYLKYIISTPTKFDSKNRISLTSACKKYAKIEPGTEIVIVGAHVWYGIWHSEVWDKLMQHKFSNLQDDKRTINVDKAISLGVPTCPNDTFKNPVAPLYLK